MSCGDIQILQSPDSVKVKISPTEISLNQSPDSASLKICPTNIQILQEVKMIKMCATNPVFNDFIPFFFTAKQGQSVFTLPNIALATWVFINGIAQSQAKTPTPDFTINDNILTLSQGVDAGDIVFGMIQTV